MVYKVDIKTILDACSEQFVIVKKDGNLYEYEIGNDIDIFARDAMKLVQEILYISTNEASVKVATCDGHSHIDFMEGNVLIVRLDIIDTLDLYKDLLLENNNYAQLAFRLFEYAKCPHKQKHLDFVKNEFSKEQ